MVLVHQQVPLDSKLDADAQGVKGSVRQSRLYARNAETPAGAGASKTVGIARSAT
jgi:hypothetical protein